MSSRKLPKWGGQYEVQPGVIITFNNTCPMDNILLILTELLANNEQVHKALAQHRGPACRTLMLVHRMYAKGRYNQAVADPGGGK